MEESSNGKIEEIEKVEIEENDSKLGSEETEKLKASVDGNSETIKQSFDSEEKEITFEQDLENSESVKESLDAEEKESSTLQDSEEPEKGKEEEVIDIIVNSDEHIEETLEATAEGIGETETKSKGIDETETESKGIDEAEIEPKGFDGGAEGMDETEDKNPTSSVDKDELTASPAVIEESSLNETENTQVVTRGIETEETRVEEKSTVVDSLKPLPNAVIVGSNDAFPETTQDPQRVMSVSQRTSWRSCCGLLQVLRRSNT